MRSILVCSLLAVACSVSSVSAQDAGPDAVAAELRDLQHELKSQQGLKSGVASRMLSSLPAEWRVQTSEGAYSISTEPLRHFLQASDQESADQWLEHAAEDLESWQQTAEHPPNARSKLESILARREFARGGPPGPLELLRQRALAQLRRFAQWLLKMVLLHPGASRALFWTLVAAAALVLIAWLIRLGKREGTFIALRSPDGELPLRDWEEWLAAARASAEAGDLRQAIHASYWAGVTRLQQTGVLSKERTLTPREYLRLADGSGSAAGHLNALTRSLERVWYANRTASMDDFKESLQHLEAIGCKVA